MTPPTLDTPLAPALELSNITKSFGPSIALANATVVVRRGTIHAVLGENGAGKTTLMRIAYGMMRPDRGRIQVDGRLVRFTSPADSIAVGIGMVHQHFTLVPAMTVAENLALGGHGRLRRRDMIAHVDALAVRTGFALDAHARVEDLSVAAQQRVEIAKALGRNASLLILDEPTAVLAPTESEDLLRWLRAFVVEGRSVVLVTHKLRDALAIADEVTVLRNGRCVYTGSAAQSSVSQLASSMVGVVTEQVDSVVIDRQVVAAQPVFRADGISVADKSGRTRIREASFTFYAGECVGIVAVEGSGQRELLRALAGRVPISAGRWTVPPSLGLFPRTGMPTVCCSRAHSWRPSHCAVPGVVWESYPGRSYGNSRHASSPSTTCGRPVAVKWYERCREATNRN
ncbi:MAG: ATP-binding cassette domain-containing protein [Gemmatimonadota bacterium]|nr:ATP-binding cassette domain-containing protein [Gemmatimonadota bacterium]